MRLVGQMGTVMFLVWGLVVHAAMAQSAIAGPQLRKRPPNILWIVAENFDLDFGCYGAQHVKTPNVDGLASAGVCYTRAFSTSPVCAPSRSAFMS